MCPNKLNSESKLSQRMEIPFQSAANKCHCIMSALATEFSQKWQLGWDLCTTKAASRGIVIGRSVAGETRPFSSAWILCLEILKGKAVEWPGNNCK